MMMKKRLFSSLFLFGSLVSQAQHEYTIEGKVEGVKDGTLVSLFLLDGNVGSTVAMDTIQNGTFFFKRNAGEDGLDKLSLMCTRNDNFPSMSLEIYATPNARIKVTGTNTLIHTWTVDSPVKEQIEYNRFIEDSHDLWDEYQRLSIKARSLRSAPEAERKALRAKEDSISALISKREMKLMQELPVSNIWMDRLYKLSMSVKYNPNFSYKDETLALYNRMNEAQKTSITGQEITVNLFPPTVVKEGDKMADTELFDLDGKIHHLTDFNGKYILLDFWSSGCGPCIMALPEMKEIQEQYKERLTIISLSSDTKSRWKAASAKHEMSITWQGNTKVVNYPVSESTNTDILEVKQVVLTDTATIVHFNAYYIPKYWIRVSPNCRLVDEKGEMYTLKKADGIKPGEHFYLPESGEAEFSLTFEPLSSSVQSFNFTEGTEKNDWQ